MSETDITPDAEAQEPTQDETPQGPTVDEQEPTGTSPEDPAAADEASPLSDEAPRIGSVVTYHGNVCRVCGLVEEKFPGSVGQGFQKRLSALLLPVATTQTQTLAHMTPAPVDQLKTVEQAKAEIEQQAATAAD